LYICRCREHLLDKARQLETDSVDGLNSLAGYSVRIDRRKLFTRFYVDINQKYVMAAAAAALSQYTLSSSVIECHRCTA